MADKLSRHVMESGGVSCGCFGLSGLIMGYMGSPRSSSVL